MSALDEAAGVDYLVECDIMFFDVAQLVRLRLRYNFDWNPAKERTNIRKHGVSFRRAATVFRDPNHLSIYDEKHSERGERWISMGFDDTGVLRVVIHTFEQMEKNLCEIRIISARKATSAEAKQYREANP